MCDYRHQNCGPTSPEDKERLKAAGIGGGVFVAVVFAILLMCWIVSSQNKKAALEAQAKRDAQAEEERRLQEREIEMVRQFEAQEGELRSAEEGRGGVGITSLEYPWQRSEVVPVVPTVPPPAYVERS